MKNIFLKYRLGLQKKNVFKGIFFGLFFLSLYSSMAQVNYVRTWTATAPEPNPNNLMTRPLSDAKEVTQYFDGLGRPIQTVAKQGTSSADLVSMVGYDNLGRQNGQYLPYEANSSDGSYQTDAFTAQPAFYNGTSPVSGQGESGTYAHTLINFEQSPLNRPILTMAPGINWVGNNKGVQSGYWTNTVTDDVKIWNVTNNTQGAFGSYSTTSSYPAGTLYKNITVDENLNQVVEFKDLDGKLILKKVTLSASDDGSGSGYANWLCTFYIYDILNNLRCVIQPDGVQALSGNGWSMNSTILTEQCFRYEYDQRNRMIMKQVPGTGLGTDNGAVYMVYDNVDRLVMTQDANLRNLATPQWMITVYDALNRPTQTGLVNGTSGDFSTNLNAAYTSTSYPSTSGGFDVQTVTHYDDYSSIPTNSPSGLSGSFISNSNWNSFFSATSLSYPYPVLPVQKSNTAISYNGMVTWTQVKVINSGTPGTYLTTVNIYDDKGRVVQTQSQNYTGGINVTTTQYNWAGQPLVVVQSQVKAGTNQQTTVTVSQMSYDNLNRLVNTSKQIQNTLVNNNAIQVNNVSALQYDVLGQLNTKNLGALSNPLETMTYDYNIRGWLLGVNRLFVKNTSNNSYTNSGETFTTPTCYCAGNFFGFELGYDKAPTVGGANWSYAAQLNGNITGTIWKNVYDGEIRKYDFSYDAANRLTKADFSQFTNGSFNQSAGINYNASMSYDANGNILNMNQFGLASTGATSSVPIDLLTYNYISGTNRLQSVTDGANSNTPAPGTSNYLGDFHYNTSGTASTYSYDGNGNLTSDGNKNINSIVYNYLNLPQTINVSGNRTINYTYDAAGNKLQKQTNDNGVVATTTYIGGIVYQNDVLQFIPHEEGRIRVNSNNNGYIYDYFLKDHLGNTRMTITDDNTVANHFIDATNYYPFGLTMAGISYKLPGSLENKYKFQKQEFQHQEFSDLSGLELYEFKYRFDDPQIGRFWSVDPLANKFVYNSPYAFSENKVTGHIELEGLEAVPYGILIQQGINWFAERISSAKEASMRLANGTSGHAESEYVPEPLKQTFKSIGIANDFNKAVVPYVDILQAVNIMASFVPFGEAGLVQEGKLAVNLFTEGMSSVNKGKLGESLTKEILLKEFKNVTILEQVEMKLDGATMKADFVVVKNGKVIAVAESKVDGGKLSNGQKLFFNDGDAAVLSGKNTPKEMQGLKIDPSKIETPIYKWDSKTGTFSLN